MSPAPDLQEILATQVFSGGANRPFGELTSDDVRARADELRAATGWGPTARVAPVARAWRELSIEMERAGVASVSSWTISPSARNRIRAAIAAASPTGPPPAITTSGTIDYHGIRINSEQKPGPIAPSRPSVPGPADES